ncbi:hypothetical protein [Cellulophaga sp. L1A9]|uniref:hypothetical protein n=1 Tax=Cellulophaga sp. L1A9 TaxID=2686362 RepID=UPI00131BFF8A|nr:hypothetical protein [Cellulophaga sp. L1A9]
MKKNSLLLILLLLLVIQSCARRIDIDRNGYSLSHFRTIEEQYTGGEIIDPSVYALSEDYDIISFIRKDNTVPDLDLIVRYVYAKKDSVVAEIRYELDTDDTHQKKSLAFRKALAAHFLNVAEITSATNTKKAEHGTFDAQTTINDADDYYKAIYWTEERVNTTLVLQMSNTLQPETNTYPNHKVHVTYQLVSEHNTMPKSSLIGRKEVKNQASKTPKFSNTTTIPLLPGCINTPTEDCFLTTINNKVLALAKQKGVALVADTLIIGVRVNQEGVPSLFRTKSTNPELPEICKTVIASLTNVEPSYSSDNEAYVTSSYSWYIIFKDDEILIQ